MLRKKNNLAIRPRATRITGTRTLEGWVRPGTSGNRRGLVLISS
jgi:hypothetical protein